MGIKANKTTPSQSNRKLIGMRALVVKKLEKMGRELYNAPRRVLLGNESWKDDVPGNGGVYVIWSKKSGKPIYVGETSHLNHRCIDLGRTVNHTFRRKMAAQYKMQGFSDSKLSKKLSIKFLYSFLSVDLGRKELEEYLLLKWKESLVNKPPKRLLLRDYPYSF